MKKIIAFCLLAFISVTTLNAQNTLDLVGLTASNPSATAYSLRKLSSSYSGSAIQVRRSSDNSTQNIGFTANGDLDTTALKAFVGNNDGYVTIWYDQSGNNRNLTQSSLTMQPTIVSAGVIYRKGTMPALFLDGTDDGMLNNGDDYLTANPISVNLVAGSNSSAGSARRAIQGTENWLVGPYENLHSWFAGDWNHTASPAWSLTQSEVFTVIQPVSTSCTSWRNGISEPSNDNKVAPNKIQIGAEGAFPEALDGHINEVISFNSELSNTDRQTLEHNQVFYYDLCKTSSTTNQSICTSALPYSWNGLIFTGAGSQTAHLTNAAGCDSAATLILNVKLPLDRLGFNCSNFAAVAYSLRKLSNSYGGSAIQVRRSSDSATQNIGFTANGDLDTASLKTFVGNNDGYVTIWYDQSGSDRNLTQSSLAMQPTIVSAGIIYRKGTMPALFLDGSDDGMLNNGADYLTANPISVNLVAGSNSSAVSARRAIQGTQNWLVGPYANLHTWFAGNWNHYASPAWSLTQSEVFTVIQPVSTSCTSWRNGISEPSSDNKVAPNKIQIGAEGVSPEALDGHINEVISFNLELSNTDRQILEHNQAFYYDICKTSSTTNLDICLSQLPYSWNNLSITSGGTYDVHLTNTAGCDSLVTLHLTVNSTVTPDISINTASTNVCSGDKVTFTAVATNPGSSPKYFWNINGNSIGAGKIVTFLPNTFANGDVITCVLTANNTCQTIATANSNAIQMTVKQSSAVAPITNGISVINAATLCTLGSATPYFNATGYGVWTSSDPSIASVSSASKKGVVTANSNGKTTLTYSITAANGCVSASIVKLAVAAITPNVISGTNSVCVNATTALSSTAPIGTTGVWTSSNNRGSINASGIYIGANAGAGEARYTVTNSTTDCKAYSTYAITVNAIPSVPSITYAAGTLNPQAGAPTGSYCVGKVFNVVGAPTGGAWSATGITSITSGGQVTINAVGSGSIKYTYTSAAGCVNSRTMVGTGYICAARGVNTVDGQQSTINGFTMYPNPAKSVININVETLIGKGSIIVTDLYGKTLKAQPLSMGTNTVDIANLSKGMYFVSMITSQGKTTKKLVVE